MNLENNIKKTKIYFSLITLILIVVIVGGVFVIKDNAYLTKKYAEKNLNTYKYKLEFAQVNKDSTLNNFTGKDESNAHSVSVLLYHGIVSESDGANVLLEDFKDQMFALKKAGYETINLEDFYKFMKGEKELPDKSFLLTFDDGRKDSYYSADPILKALDYNAVLFVITEHSLSEKDSSFYLSERELKQMLRTGRWEIQSHGRDAHDFYEIDDDGNGGHFLSNKLWLKDENRLETEEEFKERIYLDLSASKQDLEENFGIEIISFAFPFGDFGQETINFPDSKLIILDIVKQVYPLAFYQIWPDYNPAFNFPNKGSFMMKRINVNPEWDDSYLLNLMEELSSQEIS